MVPSVTKMIRDLWSSSPFEHWEVPARFDPGRHFLRLLVVDCRSERLHRFCLHQFMEGSLRWSSSPKLTLCPSALR